ncbi:MAG: hypothetical protein LBS50_10345 [Prevotellaceae bacterium]|jgi:hypothetical protein|nr:hypothetical protein [Prevotellaceae bacterium]
MTTNIEAAKQVIVLKLEELKQRISANIQVSGRSASGRSAQSLVVETTEKGAVLKGRRAFGTLETGRKSGKVPYNFKSIILQWMRDKGIKGTSIPYLRTPSERWQPKYTPQERGDLSLAGAITHKIRTEGTTLFRSGGASDIYTQEIPKTIAEIQNEIRTFFVGEISNIKLN